MKRVVEKSVFIPCGGATGKQLTLFTYDRLALELLTPALHVKQQMKDDYNSFNVL